MIEIGGEFQWPGSSEGPYLPWPSPCAYFATARAAAAHVWSSNHSEKSHRSLWVPVYFCPHTTEYWRRTGVSIKRYADSPAQLEPDWHTLRAEHDDIVIAVNYFGIREAAPWEEWHAKHPDILLVEDHTHDTFSNWTRLNHADYAFSSIRKTYPVADGAILWSPSGRELPSEAKGTDWTASGLKLAAMIWKAEYLASPSQSDKKDEFRKFQSLGEKCFEDNPDQQMAPWSRAEIKAGFPVKWRAAREQNVGFLLSNLPENGPIKPLFRNWPLGNCPFNVVLVCDSPNTRDRLQHHLIEHGIYTPIHWQIPSGSAMSARDLSRRILTVPVDHRYDIPEISYIAYVLNQYLHLQTPS